MSHVLLVTHRTPFAVQRLPSDQTGSVLLLLELLTRRVLSHHINCSSISNSSGSTSSSAAPRLHQALHTLLSGPKTDYKRLYQGTLPILMSSVLRRPQLQPGLFALLASLHKQSRQQSMRSQLRVAEAALCMAEQAVDTLSDAGVHTMVDLRTWRAMVAPWVVLMGLHFCQLGHWLQQWQREQLRQLRQLQQSNASCAPTAAEGVRWRKFMK